MVHAADPYYTSTVQWATSFNHTAAGTGSSQAMCMTADPTTGASYIGGRCSGFLPIYNLTTLECTTNDMYIIKTGADGTPLKAVRFGTAASTMIKRTYSL
jgi:hypothetical protein